MNQENNNEIDLMLRKLGRQGVNASTGVGGEGTDHLDADELNMYAENVLAPKTRARFTEHLADCTHCRQLVSQLSIAAGLVVQEKKTESPTPTGFMALLASFFSPMVLRYAVPALGLVVVTSIAVLVFRDSANQQRYTVSAPKEAVQSVAKNETPTPANVLTDSYRTNANESSSTSGEKERQSEQSRDEKAPAKTGEAELAKESPEAKRDEPAKATDQVAAAPATAGATYATATPISKQAADEAPKAGQDVAEKKKQPAEESAANVEAAKTQAKAEDQRKVGGAGLARLEPANRSAPSTNAQQRSRENEADERGRRADKDDAETRSVAGRQFRREGSTWIDTAYGSQATTVVSRGSEQFRALVADEPAIKTIADQLGGEVIVVWKGRAYRIK